MNRCWCDNERLEEYSNAYFKCAKCGSLVSKNEFSRDIVDVKDEEHDLYGVKYWEEGMLAKAGVSSLNALHMQYMTGRVPYWFQKLLEYIPLNDKMVEVGCGLGELSYILQKAGCQITAYELSEDNCQYVRQKFGIDIKSEEFTQQQKGLGAIIAMDVYEHLLDPLVFLRNCRESLKEEGVLCIQTPCYNPELSFEQVDKADLNFKKLLVPDEHIFLYSRQSIVKALEENGFLYHEFVPAYFGDDYDMFLFASAHRIKKNSAEEIKNFLAKTKNEMLLRSWTELFDQNTREKQLNEQMAKNTKQQLCDIETLTTAVKEKDEYIKELEKNNKLQVIDLGTLSEQIRGKEAFISELKQNNKLQIQDIETLTKQVKDREAHISELEQNNKLQVTDIETLTKQVKEKETHVNELEQNNTLQIADIETLTKQVKEKEAHISELEQNNRMQIQNIETLIEQASILQQGCDERLSAIETLNEKLRMTEEKLQKEIERNIQVEQVLNTQIIERDNQIKVLEEACEERLKNILTLTDIINHMKKEND